MTGGERDKMLGQQEFSERRQKAKCSLSSLTEPEHPKILYALIDASYATPLMLNGLPGSAPMIP